MSIWYLTNNKESQIEALFSTTNIPLSLLLQMELLKRWRHIALQKYIHIWNSQITRKISIYKRHPHALLLRITVKPTHSTRHYAKTQVKMSITKRIRGVEKMAITTTGERPDDGEMQPNRPASSVRPEIHTDSSSKASITSAMQIRGGGGPTSHFFNRHWRWTRMLLRRHVRISNSLAIDPFSGRWSLFRS